MQINILLFSSFKDVAGRSRLTLTLPQTNATVTDVRLALLQQFPGMQPHFANVVAAVNREYAFDEDPVANGDEVAFFPPVSGGSDTLDARPEIFRLTTEPIRHDAIIAAITTPATGAVCSFSGTVRGQTTLPGHLPQTLRLEYEAYEPMALGKMRQLAAEIRQKWPLIVGIALIQRVGELEVGENAVLIACSSAHRDQGCFEAARYGIDRLKEIVPVWKKEISPDGTVWIEGDYIPTPADRTDQL